MDARYLLLPILTAFLSAALAYGIPFRSARLHKLFLFAATTLTAAATWLPILWRPAGSLVLYRFSEHFELALKLDGMGVFFAGMTSLLWPFATLYAFAYMRHEKHNRMFFTFYLLTFGVTEGIAFSGNLITAFVFYEMLTLSTLPLVLSRFNEDSQYAARRYAIYCLGGSAFAFIGVVFLSVYGNGAFFTPGGVLQGAAIGREWMLGVFLVSFFGFGVKAAVFPYHAWLPMASVAPTPVTALLHAVAVVKSGVFLIIRLTWFAFGADYLRGTWAQTAALCFVIFTVVYGAVMAVRERHFKRRLAYSTVSNLSYILFGVLLLTEAGLAAGLTHMLIHAFMKIGAFMCAGAFMHVTGREYLFELDGVGKKMPVTFALYTIFALSLTGVPLTGGFVSKYRLVMAGLGSETALGTPGAAGLIVAAFLCAVYAFTVSVRAFFPKKGGDRFLMTNVTDPEAMMLVPIALFALLTLLTGIWPEPILRLTAAAAASALS